MEGERFTERLNRVLPGLMDAHVHLVRSAGPDPTYDVRHENDNILMLRCAKNSGDLLRAGVTTIRDVGAPNNTIFDFRGGAERGLVTAPRILAAGPALTRTGGHMSYEGGSIDNPWSIRQAVRERLAKGADVIKIPITGGLLVHGGRDAFSLTYTDEEMLAAVEEAHRFGRRVSVHCLGMDGIKQAHRVGVDMIEHYTHLAGPDDWTWDERLAEETIKREMFVTTTIAAGFRAHEHVKAGGTLPNLDPHLSSQFSDRYILYMAFNTLVALDRSFNVMPELARSWQVSPDGKQITFELQRGVKFHDGTDFNAEAVKWNIERILDPATNSTSRTLIEPAIAAVKVADPYKVVFELKQPFPPLLAALAERPGFMVSPAAVKQLGPDFGQRPVGTGPFRVTEWVQDSHVTLERFADYWEKGKPYLDKVTVRVVPDATVGLTMVRTGEVDLATDVDAKDIPGLAGDPSVRSFGSRHGRAAVWDPCRDRRRGRDEGLITAVGPDKSLKAGDPGSSLEPRF